jgi:hypothetical protein
MWQWQPDPHAGYSVRDAYQLLTFKGLGYYFVGGGIPSVKQRGRLEGIYFCVASLTQPVANEIKLGYSRHSLSISSLMRVRMWRRRIGSTLFLSCSTFGSLWALVRSWIDFLTVDAQNLSDHFIQFTFSVSGL